MISSADIDELLRHYDLGPVESVSHARRGFVNETAFVTTLRGRFVIRRSHRRITEANHRYRHDLVHFLLAREFPAPRIISTRNGDTLMVLNGRFYEVLEFIAGEDFNHSRPGQQYSAGELLARYHHTIEGFAPPPGTSDPRYSPQTVLGLTERLLERDMMGELHDPLSWYDMRAVAIRRLMPRDFYEILPHLVIHGDIHTDNMLFACEEAIALIDYDQVTWDARIVDLADALIGFATDHRYRERMAWGVFQGPLDEQAADRLMAGYLAVQPLNNVELQLLPLLVELIWLQGELGRVISTPDGAPDYHMEVLEQGRWLAHWIGNRRENLFEHWKELREEAARVEV